MKISHSYPPVWDDILGAGLKPNPESVLVTYGDTIYVPGGKDVPDHLMEHEDVHSNQQGDNPDEWWSRYLDDVFFRIDQETEAYARQFEFICLTVKDRNQRHQILMDLSKHLSGPMYGNSITLQDAMRTIKERSGVKP